MRSDSHAEHAPLEGNCCIGHLGAARAQRMADLLKQQIDARTAGRVQRLSVTQTDGNLLVRGQTPSFYVKQLAIAAVLNFLEGKELYADFDLQVPPELVAAKED